MTKGETIEYAIRKECSSVSLAEWCVSWEITINEFKKFLALGREAFDAVERKTGKWIERNLQSSDRCRLIECDKCGFSHIVGFNVPYEHWIENRNFCERCGADMRGDAERKDGD